jgi:hypothetical protein
MMLKTVCNDAIRASTDGRDAFVDPADGRAECDADLAHLALVAQRTEDLPQRVVLDGLDAGVVQLVQIDVVGPEPAQRSFELQPDRRRFPVLRSLGLAGEHAGRVVLVAALRGEDDLVAVRLQDVREEGLTDPVVAVDRRGVDEVDARVERGVQQPLLVLDDAPPVAGDRPGAEADLRDLELALTEAPIPQGSP